MANEKNYDREDKKAAKARGENPDPITGAPGSHPAGTAVGGVAGAAAGAAAGTAVGGPLGGLVGGTIGAVAGGAGGKAVAEEVNPTVEDAYWREHYSNEPYYDRNTLTTIISLPTAPAMKVIRSTATPESRSMNWNPPCAAIMNEPRANPN